MATAKTKRKQRMEKNAESRTLSAWRGTGKLLALLQRATPSIVNDSFAVHALQRTN